MLIQSKETDINYFIDRWNTQENRQKQQQQHQKKFTHSFIQYSIFKDPFKNKNRIRTKQTKKTINEISF